jgi:hypothetical protein
MFCCYCLKLLMLTCRCLRLLFVAVTFRCCCAAVVCTSITPSFPPFFSFPSHPLLLPFSSPSHSHSHPLLIPFSTPSPPLLNPFSSPSHPLLLTHTKPQPHSSFYALLCFLLRFAVLCFVASACARAFVVLLWLLCCCAVVLLRC